MKKNDFLTNGYVLVSDFFDKEEIDKIKEDAKQVFINQMLCHKIINKEILSEDDFEKGMTKFFQTNIQGFINSGKTCQHLISLHKLSLNDKLLDALKKLGIESPNICTRPVLYFNSKNLAKKEIHYKTPPHQDWRSMQGSLNSIVVWIPLIDIDVNLGALEIIPKSHLLGLMDSEEDEWFRRINVENKEFKSISVKKGDALFFSSFLIHKSGNNITDSIRWSCHFRYNDLNESTFIKRSYPNPYNYAPQQDLITPDFPLEQTIQNYFKNGNN
jgi:phytanoyl-CoA hydroxylase